MSCLISRAASALRPARARTSLATTAKPRPSLTGAGRFNRRIQRQRSGLEGNRINHANDVADTGTGLDFPMLRTTELHGGPPLGGHLAGFLRKLVGLLSTGSVLAHGRRLLHGGRDCCRALAWCSCGRQILVALRNFPRTGRGNAFRALAHPARRLHQTGLHLLQ